jgi:hypothetical protein
LAWIESHQALGHHPKTLRLAAELKSSVPCAIGYLHLLWWWALDYAPDGQLPLSQKPVVARACMWSRKSELFWAALLSAGFVEQTGEELRIHDWMDYAGKLAEQRALRKESNRKAQIKRRQQKVSADSALTRDDSQRLVSSDKKNRQQSTGPDQPDLPLVGQSVGDSARARARGEHDLAPLSSALNAALPEEVRRRLAQPPIHVPADQPTDRLTNSSS